MATHYHHKNNPPISGTSAESLLAAIDAFIANGRRPAVLEYGENAVPLIEGHYSLEIRSGKLYIEIWDETRSISRRILTVDRAATGVLDCTIQKFGGKPGRLTFLDLDRPQTAHRALCGVRQSFAEQFRRMLSRQFPGWQIDAVSAGMDLQRSFSGRYPRAKLVRGSGQIAAMACASVEEEPGLLTPALLWFDHLRLHGPANSHTSLCLFLPEGAGNATAHRLRWLNSAELNPHLYLFNACGSAGEVDPQDLGNLQTHLAGHHEKVSHFEAAGGQPERWLESVVRANLLTIDPSLRPELVHSQVVTFAASDRDLIDLLAVSSSGRLTVLELKVSEDMQLPVQALDYWMRVAWHAKRDELRHLFPGVSLESEPPKLLLIAPAMSFHSSNATILRYFSPEIDVERVGVNSDWQNQLRVVLRLKGAQAPISHGASNG